MNRQQRRAAIKASGPSSADDAALLAEQARSALAQGNTRVALPLLRRMVKIRPEEGVFWHALGQALVADGRPGEAAAAFDKACRLQPGDCSCLLDLGAARQEMGRFDEAEDIYRKVPADDPGFPAAQGKLASVLKAREKYEEALAAQTVAVAGNPDDPQERFNLALLLLALGRFDDGWEAYEARLRIPGLDIHTGFRQPQWTGENLSGKTLLVHGEQGLGDMIQFVRYLPLLAGRAERILLAVPPMLVELLRDLPGVDALLTGQGPAPSFDYHCPLLSLPRAFGTRLDSIPADIPYLHADPKRVALISQRFSVLAEPAIKVGLVWAGQSRSHNRQAHQMDLLRSMRLSDFAPLARESGVRFVSLQKGEAAAQAKKPPGGLVLFDPMSRIDDFSDTAAIIAHLDLVITVDTAVAHLAGALGKPVWILSRFDGCWRWLLGRNTSPWYPTARLFRQTKPGDWTGVMAHVAEDFANFVGERRV
ncbi:tetratricopeptide repeat-containing glycosyltransferase family protein [Telmatospirillum sp.]|uniref:tetratricopeptide repeat-containing glycosyltransferase family protein n=1 Tax=Telmatospirillum sp. TaxID=2079197 RepID=UPI002847C4C0|nr:tetratricopeptide repeat-containing glycosyltransferase family protein [Telmatospirillum sp.]MDR3436839.1 tetratricopeptide repeat-containing glycosyltransferase family protein [Telmatospirillum sp.]